jgi:MFS family permease
MGTKINRAISSTFKNGVFTMDNNASNQGVAITPSMRTLHGLDWFNFFLADVQTGIGPFLAIYLAGYGWNEQRVGLALTVGGISGILTQIPAGALVDQFRSKRALIAIGILSLATGALLIGFMPIFWYVMSAQVFIGGTSSIFGPAICAVSLGIVGRKLFDHRQGRNQTFNSAGNVVAAVSMGLLGHFISNRSIFFFVFLCAIPTILTLLLIRPNEIDYERARGAKEGNENSQPVGAPFAHFPRLRSDVPLCQCRDAAAFGRAACQGARSKLDDVHVGMRSDHAACHHVACFMVGAKSGVLG